MMNMDDRSREIEPSKEHGANYTDVEQDEGETEEDLIKFRIKLE